MREILFRAKDDYGRWVFGSYVHSETHFPNDDKDFIIPRKVIGNSDFSQIPIDIETLGQYTGIRENGSPIFEGDIVRCRDYRIASIKFVGKVGFKDGSFVIEDGEIAHFRWVDYEVDVIGNIYDTPALMKGATDHETD